MKAASKYCPSCEKECEPDEAGFYHCCEWYWKIPEEETN